jgi:hypothetical protein
MDLGDGVGFGFVFGFGLVSVWWHIIQP